MSLPPPVLIKMLPALDTDALKWIAANAVYPLGALIAALWASINHRIKGIERKADIAASKEELREIKNKLDNAIYRTEFDHALSDSREDITALRVDIKELFGKSDAAKELINQRVSDLDRHMTAKLDAIRNDMNGGFQRMMEQRK